jgi:hypothetical protein
VHEPVIVDPSAAAANTGRWTINGRATALASRSRIARELGPGSSVRSTIVRVTAIA